MMKGSLSKYPYVQDFLKHDFYKVVNCISLCFRNNNSNTGGGVS